MKELDRFLYPARSAISLIPGCRGGTLLHDVLTMHSGSGGCPPFSIQS